MAERFNPRSYMKLLRMLGGVIKPAEAKNAKEVQSAVEEWETKVARLEDEYGEKINNNMKVAILISMVPEALQEKIFEIEKGGAEVKYEAAKEVAVSTALRRAEQRRPKEDELIMSMEMQKQAEEGEEWAWMIDQAEAPGWYGCWGEDGTDINAVGMGKGSLSTKCHRCGEMGHRGSAHPPGTC